MPIRPRPTCPWPTRVLISALFVSAASAQTWTPFATVVPAELSAWDLARDRLLVVGTDTAQRIHEWDGSQFRERPGELAPQRTLAQMVYDPTQRRVLAVSTDSWVGSWSRGQWTWAKSGAAPANNAVRAIAYDQARQRLVAIGTPGMWEWDGTRWWDLSSFGNGWVASTAFAFDPISQRCILYAQGATRSWDGFAWTQLTGATAANRADAGLALDASRQQLVLYGGSPTNTDTWTWNGTAWSQIPTTSDPGPVTDGQMHDDGVGVTMFVPATGRIWQLRGSAWTLARSAPRLPSYRTNTAFAYDQVRDVLVGFGGDNGGLNVPPDQTMLFDRGWLDCDPATNPPLRHSAHLAWSDLNQQVLLFGGVYQGTIHRGDTWLWDGTDWQQQQPSQSPSPRQGAVMARDPLGGVMLFGDQWRWNGTTWTPVTPATMPAARTRTMHAYDPTRGQVVVQGGLNSSLQPIAETWTWDGAAWTLQAVTVQPAQMRTAAFRPETNRVVVADTNTAYEWNGSDWLSSSGLGTGVGQPQQARYATHFGMQRTLNFSVPTVRRLQAIAAQVDAYGSPCSIGPTPALAPIATPAFDTDFALEVASASGAAPTFLVLGLAAQNVDLGNGCRALIALDLGVLFAPANTGGIARFALPIPNDPGLLGVQFTAQGAVLDPAASPLGSFVLTAGRRMFVGE